MPAAQVLPQGPDFGSQLGAMLGGGISQGLGQSLGSFFETKQKQAQTQQLLQALGIQAPQQGKNGTGAALGALSAEAPSQSAGIDGLQLTPEKIIAGAILGDQLGLPHLGTALAGAYEGQQKQNMQERKERFSREQAAEPELQKIGSRLRATEQSGMRFERLGELFSPENESKFPPTWTVGLLTKEGELTPLAQSQLSPEAQESVKLITDEIQGIKDTLGAQISGFEVRTYLNRLPKLLNTAEGKRRVLRDLQIINQINQMHDQGILDIVDRNGGPGKVSISKAEQIFRHENKQALNELKEEFVHPNKTSFQGQPDAARYAGRKMVDQETGQVLRSNGKEWVPEKK